MAGAASLFSTSTGLCADSVESVPGCSGLFALATYQVDKHEQDQAQSSSSSSTRPARTDDNDENNDHSDDGDDTDGSTSASPAYTRRGTCSLYYASSATNEGKVECDKVDVIETPAILDMKWSLTQAGSGVRRMLGVANAKGHITLHRLQGDGSSSRLHSIGELQFNDRNALCLSLDFSDRTGGHAGGYNMSNLATDTSMIVSQSDGSLAYLPSVEAALSTVSVDEVTSDLAQTSIHKPASSNDDASESDDDWDRSSADERDATLLAAHAALNADRPNKPRGLTTWSAHDFEAWIAAFDCFTPTTVWSGGDDLTLKGWDMRSPVAPSTVPHPTFACTKPFDGGVTSLQSHHLHQHIWAVGSYDGKLRLWDARMPTRALSETVVGGGVWRVKWHPVDPSVLLVGCMHDGFKVLRLDELGEDGAGGAALRGKEFEVVTRFDGHESLAYGCDWQRDSDDGVDGQGRKVYSCSFYDSSLHIWDSQTP
ncbi:WD40 repeat [Kalmanozyma brasiliensis GHG001]|uniref:methylated diphthine methylhydrolase n=1 Tax=Kalmanozyma brasiliensis (strain GHG001) TaxID=1365824 RepID=V5EBC0_KALBG|nr:WD40 repeat [Kalmanozyma brasiliensis GHG001]EST07691.1 WD40 repeat [Kalmanozyma brasiliensis GHG001]